MVLGGGDGREGRLLLGVEAAAGRQQRAAIGNGDGKESEAASCGCSKRCVVWDGKAHERGARAESLGEAQQ